MSIEDIQQPINSERILRYIESKEIDIEKFQGFLVWTQVPNIPSVMKAGLQTPAERKEARWKYGGKLNQRWQDSSGTYITIYNASVHSFAEGRYPWPNAGQVGILIDKSLNESLWNDLDAELQKSDEEVDKNTIQAMHEGEIPPELIRALVMNKNHIALENPKDTLTKSLPIFEGNEMKVVEYQQPQAFDFTQEDYVEMLETRLARLACDETVENLVPLYNSSGVMIWPQQGGVVE